MRCLLLSVLISWFPSLMSDFNDFVKLVKGLSLGSSTSQLHDSNDAVQIREFSRAFSNTTQRSLAFPKTSPRISDSQKVVDKYNMDRRKYMVRKAPEVWIPLLLSEAKATSGKSRKRKLRVVRELRKCADPMAELPALSELEKNFFSAEELKMFQGKSLGATRKDKMEEKTESDKQPNAPEPTRVSASGETAESLQLDPQVTEIPSLLSNRGRSEVVEFRRSATRRRRKRKLEGFLYYSAGKTPKKGDPWSEM